DTLLADVASVCEGRLEALAVPEAFGRVRPERARRGAAPRRLLLRAPDAVAHVGVGRVEDPRLGEVPEVLLVLLDLLVAPRKVQGHLGHVVDAHVADVGDLEARGFDALAESRERLVGARLGGDAHVTHAQLSGEGQLLVRAVEGHLERNLDARGRAVLGASPPRSGKNPRT